MEPPKDLPEITLQPGEVHLARDPSILLTILGSCVGVTFRSPRLGAAALCHGVLPRYPQHRHSGHAHAAIDGYRYVDFCIRDLARQFDALGARRGEVEIKLFGGADVLPVSKVRSAKPTVGAQNCKRALEVLEEEGFTVLACDLGGTLGRKIQFHTGTGEVLVYKLSSNR